jgi:hypothetical protein
MKKKFLSFAMLASLFLTLMAISAAAQTLQPMTVTIPFDFTVGTTTLPAGTYTIDRTSVNTTEVFSIYDTDHQTQVVFNTHTVEAEALSAASRLQFRRHGDQYFLGQVWSGSGPIGHELSQSSLEHELAKDIKPQKGGKTEIIPVSGQ